MKRLLGIFLFILCLFPLSAQAKDVVSLDDDNDAMEPMQSAGEKAIAVIEARPFTKTGRGEIALGIGTIASDIFLVYLPVTLRGAYHIKEWVSLELSASYMGCFSNETGENQLRASGQHCMRFVTPGYEDLTQNTAQQTQLRGIKIQEYQVARFALNPVFSVFMGKFALANQGIAHFDIHLSAGLGAQIVETPDKNITGKFHYGVSVEGNLGLGLRFVFADLIGLRLDFREYLYGKQNDKGLGTASEFSLSVSCLID